MATECLREAIWGEKPPGKGVYSMNDYESRKLKLAVFRQGEVGEFLHPFL